MGIFGKKQKTRESEPNTVSDGAPIIRERLDKFVEALGKLSEMSDEIRGKVWRKWKVLDGWNSEQIANMMKEVEQKYPTLHAATEAWLEEADAEGLTGEDRSVYVAEHTAGLFKMDALNS